SRQVSQKKLAAAAILKWERSEPDGRSENGGLQNAGAVLAKRSDENKPEPRKGTDNAGYFGAGEGNRTLDTQLGKLRRRAQVTDIHEEPLYKVSQIFLVRTDSLYNGLLTSSRLPLAPIA